MLLIDFMVFTTAWQCSAEEAYTSLLVNRHYVLLLMLGVY
jgi:hypothetical protein